MKLHSCFNQVYSLHRMGIPKMLQRGLSFSQFCDIRPSPLTHKAGVHCNWCHSKDSSTDYKSKHISFPRQLFSFTEVWALPNTHTFLQLLGHVTDYIIFLAQGTFVLYNLLGKTKSSLSIFMNTEKLCSIIFFWNSKVDNNDSNYTFYFIMLVLWLTIFFQ